MAPDARLRAWSRPGGGGMKAPWPLAEPGRAAGVNVLWCSDTALWVQGLPLASEPSREAA